jgi:hypothetical protein
MLPAGLEMGIDENRSLLQLSSSNHNHSRRQSEMAFDQVLQTKANNWAHHQIISENIASKRIRFDKRSDPVIATGFATGKRQKHDVMFEAWLSNSRKFRKGMTIIRAVSSHRAGLQP